MAEPNINSSLNLFLSYDFAHHEDPAKQLGVAKDGEGKPYLVSMSKDNKNALQECNASLSLIKVIEFIRKNQESWIQEVKQRSEELIPKLEHQLACLERKVIKYNQSHVKHSIDYKNPARWKLTVKITFPNTFESKYIISKSLQKRVFFNRLTTQKNIHKKCQKIFNKNFPLKVYCYEKNCHTMHIVQVRASELFTHIIFKPATIDINSNEPFVPIDKPAANQTIFLEGIQGNASLLEKLINSLHQGAKAAQASKKSSNISAKSTHNSPNSPRITNPIVTYTYITDINNNQQTSKHSSKSDKHPHHHNNNSKSDSHKHPSSSQHHHNNNSDSHKHSSSSQHHSTSNHHSTGSPSSDYHTSSSFSHHHSCGGFSSCGGGGHHH